MAGAKITQMFASLHRNGIEHIKTVLAEQEQWMIDHQYDSVEMMRGSMSYESTANPGLYERANYMKALNSF
jgi:dihydroorotate dehydrogenase (fumarate)